MRNWTIKEAVEAINNGNQEAIVEIAKHFPNAFMAIVKNDLAMLAEGMGDKFTLRRLDFSGAGVETEGAEDTGVEVEATGAGVEDLSTLSTKQLMQLCDKRGIKVPHYGKNKQFYLDALQNAGGDDEVETEAEEAEETADAYEGKSATELYKECKKRGIKVEAKKPAKHYVAALKKADEAEVEEDNEDEDWGDGDDGEEEAPVKPAKSAKGSKTKVPAKPTSKSKASKAEEDEDGDDDWDI